MSKHFSVISCPSSCDCIANEPVLLTAANLSNPPLIAFILLGTILHLNIKFDIAGNQRINLIVLFVLYSLITATSWWDLKEQWWATLITIQILAQVKKLQNKSVARKISLISPTKSLLRIPYHTNASSKALLSKSGTKLKKDEDKTKVTPASS